MKVSESKAFENSQGGNPYKMSSMHGKMVTSQNQKVAKQMPWSRDKTTVPSQMQGAKSNTQDAV